ncbi:MAG: NADH-quinone oxidoreductase subunit N [Candidatus Latescibacteria bacterium]|jgi:NADH-quinone oxidoreductase subunit N|nr:NADH-quinone oxidoreductase subunit N [Candidatus Latescibacterota bacterium]MBT4140775.1 NADH-quinone oxidoreductase subunit N [Candidatus Latescibacterota bacterium]
MENAILFAPEIVCLIMGLILFFSTVFNASHPTVYALSIFTGVLALAASIYTLPLSGEPFFPGIYKVDFFSQLIKTALALGFLCVTITCRNPLTFHKSAWAELPFFLLFSTLGMMLMVSATELLTLYVAMELAAYPIYIVVALHRNVATNGESATKYMVQGMAASAISLYGMSFLFGTFGSTYYTDIATQFAQASTQPIFYLGLLLTLSGFFFKLGAFPFHFWAPDTYQTAPHPVITFIATVSKIGAVAILCRLLSLATPQAWDAGHFQTALMWFCILAMTVGNLSALAQKDLKRLLGYSTIAHAGYILLALQTFSQAGFTAAIFYALGYFIMSFACFLVISEIGKKEDLVTIESVSGLYKRAPLMAFTLLLGLFGLIGLPPTVGFVGKWFLFSAALERGQFYLVLVAAINATIGLYYYLMVIRQVYWVEPTTTEIFKPSPLIAVTALATIILVIAMGTFPGTFWAFAEKAASALLS